MSFAAQILLNYKSLRRENQDKIRALPMFCTEEEEGIDNFSFMPVPRWNTSPLSLSRGAFSNPSPDNRRTARKAPSVPHAV